MTILPNGKFLRNVILKALALFVAFDLVFAIGNPLPVLARFSIYNHLVPGRERFPFGENSREAYNLSLYSLEAMFTSHELNGGPKPADEYRVLLMGDSSVWGTLLRPQETLAGQLNSQGLSCNGKTVRVYNLGYPTLSLTKDLMVLDKAMAYQPDLVLWPVTLEAFPRAKQLVSPIVANNPQLVHPLIQKYNLALDPNDPALVQPDFWGRTIIGQRRALADLVRLQLYGVPWAATGVDQVYLSNYVPAQQNLEADPTYQDWQPPSLPEDALAFDVLEAGMTAAGSTPVLLINEPMLISSGANSEIRYNFFYPRWAYDQYRELLGERSKQEGWSYLDLWDLLPESEFTNSAIHLTPAGTTQLAQQIAPHILATLCQ